MNGLINLLGFGQKQYPKYPRHLEGDPFISPDKTGQQFCTSATKPIPRFNKAGECKCRCSTCGRPCNTYTHLDCRHIMCVPCFYKAVHLSDQNEIRVGLMTCSVCDKKIAIPQQLTVEDLNYSDLLGNEEELRVTHNEAKALGDEIRKTGRTAKFCNACQKYLNFPCQFYCADCRQFLCQACTASGHHGSVENQFINRKHVVLKVMNSSKNVDVLDYAVQKNSGNPVSSVYLCEGTAPSASKVSLEDIRCEAHPDQPVQFTCMTCETASICALCCIGQESAHGDGHIVMDLQKGWERIQFEIRGGERARRQASRDEIKRLGELCGSVVIQMKHDIEELNANLETVLRSLYTALEECRNNSIISVERTADHVVSYLLSNAINEETIRRVSNYIYGVNSIMKSRGLPVVQFYREWYEAALQQHRDDSQRLGKTDHFGQETPVQEVNYGSPEQVASKFEFPIPLDELQLKCEWLEAMLAKSRWITRWLEESTALQLSSAKRLEDISGKLGIAQLPNRIPSVSITSVNQYPIHIDASFTATPRSIINPLSNQNYINLGAARPPIDLLAPSSAGDSSEVISVHSMETSIDLETAVKQAMKDASRHATREPNESDEDTLESSETNSLSGSSMATSRSSGTQSVEDTSLSSSESASDES